MALGTFDQFNWDDGTQWDATSGTIAVTIPAPALVAQGNLYGSGTIAATIPRPTLVASGNMVVSGVIVGAIPRPTCIAQGNLYGFAALAFTILRPVLQAFGTEFNPLCRLPLSFPRNIDALPQQGDI